MMMGHHFREERKRCEKDIENSSYTRLLFVDQPSGDEHPNVGRSVISKEQF
jgi:hypothetical protein